MRAYRCEKCRYIIRGNVVVNLDKLKGEKEVLCPMCRHRNRVGREKAFERLVLL